ncbi:MAG: HAMP domain-containing sensor histidine kinase [Bacteroidota bacterium]
MDYRFFRIKIILRIAVILLLGYGAIYVMTQTHFWLVSFWLLLFLAIGLAELIRFLEKSKRDLGNFLLAIQQKDFTNTYPLKAKSNPNHDMYYAFNVITQEFQKLRSEKESNYHFLQAIIEHTGVALICFDENGEEITLINEAAQELFDKPYLKNLQALARIDRNMADIARRLESGERELHKIEINNNLYHLAIEAKEVKLQEQLYKLVAFQDIKNELDEQEMESWQKLIRVLTHEIKNSAIPISTLTEVINQMLLEENGDYKDLSSLDEEEVDDMRGGLKTIEKRSKGLVKFINNYDSLTKIPKPEFQSVKLAELLNHLIHLFKPKADQSKITIQAYIQDGLTINADPELVEQVVINLIKNAIEALGGQENGTINITARGSESNAVIQIEDNGPGIEKEVLENIFVPFYTTKKEGSGIGLSLTKQIMRLHKGTVSASSALGEGTTFSLEF